jgi:hypothetical protein
MNHSRPVIMQVGLLSLQVCIPDDWTDEQIISFAEKEYPCGTTAGWQIRRQSECDKILENNPSLPKEELLERVTCADRPNFVHVVLDA